MFDRDKTGSIATNMMSTILRTLGQTFEESDLEILISEIDADGKSRTRCSLHERDHEDDERQVNHKLTFFCASFLPLLFVT